MISTIGTLIGAYVLARCVAGATELDSGEVSQVGRFAYLVCFLFSAFLVFIILTIHPTAA